MLQNQARIATIHSPSPSLITMHHQASPSITIHHHASPTTTMHKNAPSSGTAIASMMKQAWTGLPLSAVTLGSPTSSMHWSFATAWVKKVVFVIRHNLNEDCGLALSSDAFSIAFKNMPASFLSPKLLTSHNLLVASPPHRQSLRYSVRRLRLNISGSNLAWDLSTRYGRPVHPSTWLRDEPKIHVCPFAHKKNDAAPGTTQFLWNFRLQSA